MKRLVFFISSLEDGGAQKVITLISNKLAEKDYEIKILKYFKGENVFKLNNKVDVDCIEDNTKTSNVIKNIKWIKNYFKENADIVISFLAPFNMIALVANKNNNIPIIVADRNDPNRLPSNIILKTLRNILYKSANSIVVQTENNKNYFGKYRNIEIIPNPLDLKGNEGLALKIKKEDLIVSVGRLEKQKNQLLLIDSFKEIHQKYPKYKLTIFGEGSYRNVLENRIKELNLQGFISLPGSSNKVIEDISTASMFVLSSDYEGMPNALAEAMGVGLPCIATNVSGVKDLINEDNGIIIDINNRNELVDSIEKLILDKELANKLANNAIKINDKLNIDSIVCLWEKQINNILK